MFCPRFSLYHKCFHTLLHPNPMSTKEEFILDYFKKDVELIPDFEKKDHSNILLDKNGLLDKLGASFKKVTKYQLKLKTKP